MTQAAAEIDTYMSAFAERASERRTAESGDLLALRQEAIARFEEAGLPTGREEAWRQTPVAPLVAAPFRPASPAGPAAARALVESSPLARTAAIRLVLANGRFVPDLSSIPAGAAGLEIHGAQGGNRSALRTPFGRIAACAGRPYVALNTAFFEDAAVMRIAAGTSIEAPVQVFHVAARRSAGEMSLPRLLVVAEPLSRATVVETFLSEADGGGRTDAVTEIEVGDGARVEHVRIQAEDPSSVHVGALDARVGRDARFVSHVVTLGARWARLEVGTVLAAPGSECFLGGLYVVDGTRHSDHRTFVDHAVPHGTSRQTYKGILGGTSRAVFLGRILVRPGAQKTEAYQSNRSLLLSEGATAFARPQLEIHADDVKCTHGATIGQLDREAFFYLRSRGLGADEARRILVRAFAGEVVDGISSAALRSALETEVASRTTAAWGAEGKA